ncbi:hypothetical protein Scep_030836 [Stephania cephalantha]|uniref:Peroxidase n=1 Tax=Stephania cephalantha TaxID=152367 RepID=A0AAP0E376_9MAGN
MDKRNSAMLVVALCSMLCFVVHGVGLSYDFYDFSCPQLEIFVRQGVASLILQDPTIPAALLRLMFHDCQVQGCDASILLDSGDSEMGSSKNFGIRHRMAILMLKSVVEAACPGRVSCADILILAARDAVALAGGPNIRVLLGRRDSVSTSYGAADASLPPASTGVDMMLSLFAAKGMTLRESVAILGAHTLGVTHCSSILERLKSQDSKDLFLKLKCRLGSLSSNLSFVQNDLTFLSFDNHYFRDAVEGRGVLRIDADMAVDPRTAIVMRQFAAKQEYFFQTFSSAFLKLSAAGVLTGNEGIIRRSCNSAG